MKACVPLLLFLITIQMQSRFIECAKKKMDLAELTEMLRPMSKSCKTKTGVSDELIEGTHRGEFPKERPLMCYFKCLSVMLKVMNKQGQVTLKAVNNQIDLLMREDLAPRLKTVGAICYEKVTPSEDICEYAMDLATCGYNEDRSLYFLP